MQHVAIIMDGNRRWARKRGLPAWEGHRAGVKSLERTVQFCLDQSIPYLSAYAFSIENFKRSIEENQYLFMIIGNELAKRGLTHFIEQGVRLRFIGDR